MASFRVLLTAALLTVACGGTMPVRSGPSVVPAGVSAEEWETLLAAEDARLASPQQLERLRDALRSESPFLRATAVRGLGRSERPDLVPIIAPMLRDTSDGVRAAAAHALGDVTRERGTAEARRMLLEVLPAPGTGGTAAAAITETLGRLPSDSTAARAVAARLAPFLGHADDARTGALRGLYLLARQPAARASVKAAAADAIRPLSRTASHARERVLAIATLALSRAADEAMLAAALQDPAPQVRREAVVAAGALADTAAIRRLTSAAAGDDSPAVRYDAVRLHAARLGTVRGCVPVVAAVRDVNVHVSLLAIGLLATTCRAGAHAMLLDSIAATAGAGWHRAAHATVSLAGIDPGRARSRASALAQHPSPFARAYAARAAAAAGDDALLHDLAHDSIPNVRTAAVAGLAAVSGHMADSVFAAQLASDESELLMAAAAALEGSRLPGVTDRLLDALDRVTALERETSRDARAALLERVEELGDASAAHRVQLYLSDFDAVIATRAAGVLQAWTGTRPQTATAPLPRLPLPTFAEAAALAERVFVLELEAGDVEVQLLPFDAPTNAARFARLARSGYFDGLTIHRVVPNFVVQGGSPGANEYSGDGPFTRDELGVPNWRGTVGLSTRGRDTGDAQFYINLVDNVRLDHEYTVFGVVTRGMDGVDRLTEGAVIRRVSERPAR
jgi:cyclophilin family peptidyl-prolyl cis-trans isomerase/HEAT repeat protein